MVEERETDAITDEKIETDAITDEKIETNLTEAEKEEMEEEQLNEEKPSGDSPISPEMETVLNESEVDEMIDSARVEYDKEKKLEMPPSGIENLKRMFEESKTRLDFMLDIDNFQISNPSQPSKQINFLTWLKSARTRFFDDEYWFQVGSEALEACSQLVSYFRSVADQKNVTWQVFMTVLSMLSNRLVEEEHKNLVFRKTMIERVADLRKQVNKISKQQVATKVVKEEMRRQEEVLHQIDKYKERGEKFANATYQDYIDDGCTEALWDSFKKEKESKIAGYIANPKTTSTTFMHNMFARSRDACEWRRVAYVQVLFANEKALKARFKPSNVDDTIKRFIEMEF